MAIRLIVGGAHQGKRAYALRETGLQPEQVLDGLDCPLTLPHDAAMLTGLHHLVRRWLHAELDPLVQVEALIEQHPDLVVVLNEVGCGVVPMEPEERLWREAVGRVGCRLAAQSERVERVICGLATSLKGGTGCTSN